MNKSIPVQPTPDTLNNRSGITSQGVGRSYAKGKRGKKDVLTVFIPHNIDLREFLSKYPTGIANAEDYIAYMLHLIHAIPAFRNNNNVAETDGYTPLNSILLQEKVDNYAPLLQWCIDVGILESDNQYSPNAKSIGYRFTESYRVELKEQPITLQTLINKINKRRKFSRTNPPVLKPENLYNFQLTELDGKDLSYAELTEQRLNHLKRWFNKDLTVHIVAAEKYVRKLMAEEQANQLVKFPMHNFNCRMLVLQALSNPTKPRFKVDETAGRLHTNLTSLQAELKAFIKYEDKTIVSADIKNSQPLLSLTLLDEALFYKNRMLQRIALYNKKFAETVTPGISNISFCSMLGNFIREHSKAKDVLLYKALVLNGRIYEYFGDLLQKHGIAVNLTDSQLRSFSKKQIFRAFFDRNTAINRSDSQPLRLFKQYFPTIFEIFSLIKSGKHNTLACALQNLEAEIVLHRACTELWEINPDMLLLTIHDSIASTEENYELVNNVLKKTLYDAIGEDVEIKREPWDETLLAKTTTYEPVIEPVIPKYKEYPQYGLYGYADKNDLLKPYSYSMKYVGNLFGISVKTLNKGLRTLGVFSYNERKHNIPAPEYMELDYFIVTETEFRFNTIQVPKATKEGIEFIGQLIAQHPDLFPPKKVRVKKYDWKKGM
jgi:hypothetical protein